MAGMTAVQWAARKVVPMEATSAAKRVGCSVAQKGSRWADGSAEQMAEAKVGRWAVTKAG